MISYTLFQQSKPLSFKRTQEGNKPKYELPPILQDIPFRTTISTFKAKYAIYCYTPSHMKAYQLHRNLGIPKKTPPCKPLVKIYDF